MADIKVSGLSAFTVFADGDLLMGVDVSVGATGENKKLTLTQLNSAIGARALNMTAAFQLNGTTLTATAAELNATEGRLDTIESTLVALDADITTLENAGYVTASSVATFTNKSGNISQWTNDAGYITSTLSEEQVEDFVGGMLSGNTTTLITVTYQDSDGTIDFVVDNDLSNYSNATSQFITSSGVTFGALDANGDVGTGSDQVAAGNHTHAQLHDAVTVLDSSEIDFTLTGQQITASIVAGSIDESKLDTSVNASLDLADSALQSGDNVSSLTNDSGYITAASVSTLTNKTFNANGTGNSITNIETEDIASGSKSGSDATLITGTEGAANRLGMWNADGDLVEAPAYLLFGFALGDETTAMTTGEKIATDTPGNCIITRVYVSVKTAPTGANMTIDVEDEGTSILNAVVSVTAGSNNGETSTFASAASSYTLTKGDLLTVDVDQVGSTIAGAGVKIYFYGVWTS